MNFCIYNYCSNQAFEINKDKYYFECVEYMKKIEQYIRRKNCKNNLIM